MLLVSHTVADGAFPKEITCLLQGGWKTKIGKSSKTLCRPLAYELNDPTVNKSHKRDCERKGYLYGWDGSFWQCIDREPRPLPDWKETKKRSDECNAAGRVLGLNPGYSSFNCYSIAIPFEDSGFNGNNYVQCENKGYRYVKVFGKDDREWACLKHIPEDIKEKCIGEYQAAPLWRNDRWYCLTKSKKEEIEASKTPVLKAENIGIRQQPKFRIRKYEPEKIYDMAFTQDQQYLMTRTSETVRVFDINLRQETFALKLDGRRVMFHKNWIVFYGSKKPMEIWDATQKKKLYTLPYENISSVFFDEKGERLFLYERKTSLTCWDISKNKLLYTVNVRKINRRMKNGMVIKDPLIYYETLDGQQAAFDSATGKDIVPMPPMEETSKPEKPLPDNLPDELKTARDKPYLSPDGSIAIGLDRQFYSIWDLREKRKIYTKERDGIQSIVSIAAGSKFFALTDTHAAYLKGSNVGGKSNSKLYLFAFENPEKVYRLGFGPDSLTTYHQEKGSNILTTGGKIAWDMEEGKGVVDQELKFPNIGGIRHIRYFSDGKRAVIGTRSRVFLYDLSEQKELALVGAGGIRTHDTTSLQVELSPDESKIVATPSLDRDIMVWDVNRSALDYTIENPSGWSNPFRITEDGKYLISLSRSPSAGEQRNYLGYSPSQGDLNIWNFKTGVLERTLPRRVNKFTLLPDTHLVITGEEDGTVSLWDYRNGMERHRLKGHKRAIQLLEVLPYNRNFMSKDVTDAILWSVGDDEIRGEKMWHDISYFHIFSPNSRFMLEIKHRYAKKPGSVRLLNLRSSQYEYAFEFPAEYYMRYAFSNDGKLFYLSTPQNETKVYEMATGKELASMYAFDNGEWVVMTPQGYFNASSPRVWEFIVDEQGKTMDEATYQSYYDPQKVKESLNSVRVKRSHF